jgi:hypothetical protein
VLVDELRDANPTRDRLVRARVARHRNVSVERDVDAGHPPGETDGLVTGARGVHKRFGAGEVRSVEHATSPPVAVVLFPGWGEKRIVATFRRPG